MDRREGQAGATDEGTAAALEAAESLIARWDQEGGLTNRQLAVRLREIFLREETPKIPL